MSDIATISLRVNTSDLDRGNRALDDFQQTASGAAKKADDLNSCFRAGAESQKKSSASLREQKQELQALLNKISPVNKALDELDTIQQNLAGFRGKSLVSLEQYERYNEILETTRTKLLETQEAETAEGRARLEQARAAQRAAATAQSFVASLEEQVNAIGKTRTELLELKAAQLGVSQQTAPLIARLREQDEAWKKGAISAGQYQQAMRMLPMQITDVVTSLASGMPVWMVAIQQGGQIKDSFGGISNALKGVMSAITPTKLALGGLVGVASLLITAWYKGSKEADAFNRQLVLTGNYAGKTAGQLNTLARTISRGGFTQGEAASALAKVVGTGKFSGSELEQVTKAALAMERAVGQSVEATISNFEKLKNAPSQASEELNQRLHYLTSAQYDYISSLERRGDKEAAAAEALRLYSDVMERQGKQIAESLGYIERAANAVTSAAKDMWDQLLNIGRPESMEDQLNKLKADLEERQKALKPERQRVGFGYSYDTSAADQEYDQQRKNQLAVIAQDKARVSVLEQALRLQNDITEAQKQAQAADEARTKSISARNRLMDEGLTNAQKRTRDLAELWKQVAAAPDAWSKEARQAAVEVINKRYAAKDSKPKGSSTVERSSDNAQRDLLALQTELDVLQKHRQANDVISQQRRSLWKTESEIAILTKKAQEEGLSQQEQITLAADKQTLAYRQQLAALGDKVEQQKKLNQLEQQATRFAEQQAAKRAEIEAKASGKSSREAQRDAERNRISTIYAGNPEALAKVRSELEATYQAEDRLRDDWRAGAKLAWADYKDSATNTFQQVYDFSQNTFTGMTSFLVDFVTTGKASFNDFLSDVLKGLAQMLVKMAEVQAMKSAMGALEGTAIGEFFGFATGGYTGPGGKYEPKGIVHGGEFVFTKEATERIGVNNLYAMMNGAPGYAEGGYVGKAPRAGLTGGGNTVAVQTSVTINQSGGNDNQQRQNSAAVQRAYEQTINESIRAGILKETRPGGIIWSATRQR
ncbi:MULTISPECIES: phage tail tape measure protein [Cronobacter]|nr:MULTISPECIES: phage tail tape measure protein [Cronobacter]MDT3594841.1 phage tail tape measure protein [Cronobacter sakazakii]USI31380.1 phage tail tape measure protein [Cronobacter sakazakii]